MNILQVTPRYPPQTGGVETQVQELSERLVEHGHEVVVHTADASREGARRETLNGVQIRRHQGVAPGGKFHVAPGIATAVRRSDTDVVHAHNLHSLPLPLAALTSTRPLVMTTYYHRKSASNWRNILWTGYRPLAGFALHRASHVTAVSKWEKESLSVDFGVNAELIPIGLDTKKFETATQIQRERPYILCVARLEEYKGIQHAIKALSKLEEYDLLIAGEGPYMAELKRLAADQLVDERVEFLGTVDYDDLPAYYAGATVFVSLSSFESFGITVAEALASGTPCVVLETTALSDWTDSPGVLGVQSVDSPTVADAIEAAIGLPVSTESVITWDEVIDRYELCYQSIIEHP